MRNEPDTRTLRPHRHLFRQAALTFLAFCIPVFAVLYWLTVPLGTWPTVIAVQVLVTAVWGLIAMSLKQASIRIEPDTLVTRSVLGRATSIKRAAISNTVMLDLFDSGDVGTSPQLFLTDARGRMLLRMSGQLWSREDMEVVADEAGSPITRVPGPMTLKDLSRARPELLPRLQRWSRWA